MCGIAGFEGKEARRRTCAMIEALRHRGPDSAAIWEEGDVCIGHTHLKITGDFAQPAVAGGIMFVFNGEIYNYRDFSPGSSDTETLAGIMAGGVERFARAAPALCGDYAIASWDGETLSLIRDPVGVKPLYYGESGEGFGFASEKKALRRAGITSVKALAPGAVYADGIERRLVELPPREPTIADESTAVHVLDERLTSAVRLRLHRDAAVAFSGGLDSALIGALAGETPLVTVGMEGSHDLRAARQAARLMGAARRHVVYEVSPAAVEEALPGTIYAVESADPMTVAIALPLYLLSQRAREDGFSVLISGQGADELFAGYARYVAGYQESRLDDMLEGDLRCIAEANLERDDAATMAHAVELRVPFLDTRVIEVARRIAPSLKVCFNGKDYIRKYVLRRVAEKHLPCEVSSAPKKAMQYGTNVQKALERLARSRGMGLAGYLKAIDRVVLE